MFKVDLHGYTIGMRTFSSSLIGYEQLKDVLKVSFLSLRFKFKI